MPTGKITKTTTYASLPLATPGVATVQELIDFTNLCLEAQIPRDVQVKLTSPTLLFGPNGPVTELKAVHSTDEEETETPR